MEITCSNVSYQYESPGDEWAVCGVDLRIGRGEKIVLVGPAGSGKTTLLQLFDALIMPTRGDILYDGLSVRAMARQKGLPSVRRRMGVLFQFPEDQFFQDTAYDELAFAMRNFFGPREQEIERRAYEITQGFGLDLALLKTTSPFRLSSGEKRKLALASALMISPEILMLDEPTAGMDAAGRRELIRILSSLDDTTVIIVTHNQEDFLGIIDRVVGISGGRKVLDVRKDLLLEHLESMERFHIVPPLVLLVQRWLSQAGIRLDRTYYDMEELISFLKGHVPGPRP
ncbi:MAG TPA: ATP-binding cassette domain-containing protein [Deltaproteobacteria bacterium]|nr:ATP-binding cassette domain-containing protein [Deltaproteobacteria bacterium]